MVRRRSRARFEPGSRAPPTIHLAAPRPPVGDGGPREPGSKRAGPRRQARHRGAARSPAPPPTPRRGPPRRGPRRPDRGRIGLTNGDPMTHKGMRFGIFLAPFHRVGENPTLALNRDMELIEWLDYLGYDEVWIGEHHSAGWELIASPEIFIAAAAERTKHIKL